MARQQKTEKLDVVVVTEPRKSLFDRVAGYLDANDWNYHAEQEKGLFDMRVGIRYASVRVIIDVDEREDWQRVTTYSIYPVVAPENRRPAVIDAINRINYSLVYGNLELDGRDGEVRIRALAEFERDLPEALMERALHGGLNLANRFFAPLMAVAFGGAAPETVLDLAASQEERKLQ
jgi:hypothetical protein